MGLAGMDGEGWLECLHHTHLLPPADMTRPDEPCSVTTNYRNEGDARTEAVDEDVVPVVLPQHTHLARLRPEPGAVQEQQDLRACQRGGASDI